MDSKSQRKRDIMKFFNLQIKLDIAVVNMTLCMSQYVQLTDGTFYVNKDEKLKHVICLHGLNISSISQGSLCNWSNGHFFSYSHG